MSDQRLGNVIRLVRRRKRWRQADLAAAADVSRALVSLVERGHLDRVSLGTLRAVGAALDVRIDAVCRWRAGELDRLLNAAHSALHESVARFFQDEATDWAVAHEVSFSVYGERGIMDVLAWHASRRHLLVIELKTEIVDVNALLGTIDRYRRLAPGIATERGWMPEVVSVWVVVAEGRTNRRRVAVHRSVLRHAFPADGRGLRSWLRDPTLPTARLSFWPDATPGSTKRGTGGSQRCRGCDPANARSRRVA